MKRPPKLSQTTTDRPAATVDVELRREKRRQACAELEKSKHPGVVEAVAGAPTDFSDDEAFWISLAGFLPAAANDPLDC